MDYLTVNWILAAANAVGWLSWAITIFVQHRRERRKSQASKKGLHH